METLEAAAREDMTNVWAWLVIAAMNYEHSGHVRQEQWQIPLGTTTAQREAYRSIQESIGYHVSDLEKEHTFPRWEEHLTYTSIGYDGAETGLPLAIRLPELAPGLPPEGLAASVRAVDLAAPAMQDWLLHPERAILPENEWPEKVPYARVHVGSQDDWDEVGAELVRLGICATARLSDAFSVRGQPVLNGAFAREKKGKPGPGQRRVCRLNHQHGADQHLPADVRERPRNP